MHATSRATPNPWTGLGDVSVLVDSFRRSLRAQAKSPRMVGNYGDGVRQFHDYLVRVGMPTAVANIPPRARRRVHHIAPGDPHDEHRRDPLPGGAAVLQASTRARSARPRCCT